MKLTAEQIEEWRAWGGRRMKERPFAGMTIGIEEFNALCDMAKSSLRVQEGVMVPRGRFNAIARAMQRLGAAGTEEEIEEVIALAAAPSQPNAETQEWWCPTCKMAVAPECVTYRETHDVRAGGCGERVGTKPAVSAPSADSWLIYFYDQDVKPEIFTDERAARTRYNELQAGWNCILFQQAAIKPKEGGAR